jgi:TolB protein
MAMALSYSGNPEIYIRDLISGQKRQLTQHWAIDTEPVWSPDSQSVYFTSDRGGRPQIYKVAAAGGKAARITREGDYNARASISPDGTRIAVAHGRAPNGSMILYATREGSRGVLSAVSADGNVRQRLILTDGDVREPAWSPVIR